MNQFIERSLSQYLLRDKQYHSPLPAALQEWYCYTVDGGHSICCILYQHISSEPSEDYLVPVPVKSVLRDWHEDNGWIVVDLPYDLKLGLLTPPEDDEY